MNVKVRVWIMEYVDLEVEKDHPLSSRDHKQIRSEEYDADTLHTVADQMYAETVRGIFIMNLQRIRVHRTFSRDYELLRDAFLDAMDLGVIGILSRCLRRQT